MNKKLILSLLFIFSLFFLVGCTEVNPYQGKIDLVSKEILMSDACAVRSDSGLCLKREEIRMSAWNIEPYESGFKVTATSYDEAMPSGLEVGKPIWYIQNNKVYWVNGAAKQISSVFVKESPEEIQDTILNPELVAKREELLNAFDIVDLNENLLYDYDETWGEYARAICDFGGHSLMKAPKTGSGTTYTFQICDKQVNLKLLKEVTHKEWKYRWYFVEVDGHQGWLQSGDLEKYNSLKPFDEELRKNSELKAKIEAEELANKNSPYLETENPNWNIVDMNREIYYWLSEDSNSESSCRNDFALYEKLADDPWYDSFGKKFGYADTCEKKLKLKVLKEATSKKRNSVYWLVDHEGSIGWINKGWMADFGELTKS